MIRIKHLLISYTLFVLVSSGLHGQNNKSKEFGITTGINFALHSGLINIEPSFIPRLSAGGFFNTKISNRSKFQIEFILNQLGSKYTYAGYWVYHGTSSMNLSYISIPSLFKIYTGKNELFNIQLGISPSVLFSAKEKGTLINFMDSQDIWERNDDELSEFKPFDIPLLIGFGFDVGNRISINYRTGYGFLNINDNQYYEDQRKFLKNETGRLPILANRYLHLNIAYRFTEKKE